jgi:hypothetical protein
VGKHAWIVSREIGPAQRARTRARDT